VAASAQQQAMLLYSASPESLVAGGDDISDIEADWS
jgi:hypothetical protein